jgi:CspA family cold shock protein
MPKGKIKKIVSDKGFGFITQDGNNNDLFFHMSSIQNAEFESLREGEAVTFEIGSGPKGPRAETVRVTED